MRRGGRPHMMSPLE